MATRNHSLALVPARDWVRGPRRPKPREAQAPQVRRSRVLPSVSWDVEPWIRRAGCPAKTREAHSVTETGLAGSFSIPGKFPTVNTLSVNVRRRLFSLKSEAACGMTRFCLPLTSGQRQPGDQGALHPEGGLLSLKAPDAGSIPCGQDCRGARLARSWAAPGPTSLSLRPAVRPLGLVPSAAL